MKIVIVGHVDHGKSSLIGRLLFETKSLPQDRLKNIETVSKELGKEMELAFIIDHLKEEREKNMTIDSSQIFFQSKKRKYTIIDAPGHAELTKNMLTGATQADAAILVIDVKEGIQEQTKRHAYLLKMIGIKTIIVVLNKMDLENYQETIFDSLKNECQNILKNLGLIPHSFIPSSCKEGENISRRSPKTPWFKGLSLIKTLDTLSQDDEIQRPLRLPIQDIYDQEGQHLIIGKVVCGLLKKGETVYLYPQGLKTKVQSIVTFDDPKKKNAEAGENIGITLKDLEPAKRGQMLSNGEPPPLINSRFKTNLFWLSETPLMLNHSFNLRLSTQDVSCHISHIEKRINSSSLEILEENAKILYFNEAGLATITCACPLIMDPFYFISETGRFILEDDKNNVVGAGTITS